MNIVVVPSGWTGSNPLLFATAADDYFILDASAVLADDFQVASISGFDAANDYVVIQNVPDTLGGWTASPPLDQGRVQQHNLYDEGHYSLFRRILVTQEPTLGQSMILPARGLVSASETRLVLPPCEPSSLTLLRDAI